MPHPTSRSGRGRSSRKIASDGAAFSANVYSETNRDNVSVMAAGVAFWTFLSIFPGMSALISIYGLVADPAVIAVQVVQPGRRSAAVDTRAALRPADPADQRAAAGSRSRAVRQSAVGLVVLDVRHRHADAGAHRRLRGARYARHLRLLCAIGGSDDRHWRIRIAEPVAGRGRAGRASNGCLFRRAGATRSGWCAGQSSPY